ncbi:dihydropteroate synthase [Taibaiella soli]|uniref:dihydropteroate synthase n=1 Tax=Taibaiella soli TaxID=1649169 RepID=A0A2W2BVZ2_9BACT|nr:dihydropteroate synthase [Taibaiella soli]PZF72003.1 dihydropteroate synthase [Taibaiella soli]
MSSKNTLLPIQTTLQSRGQLLNLECPVVMGILNVTPDSFYTKGRDSDADGLLRNAEKMLNQGARILDIGGASTRPGSDISDAEEELARVIPVMNAISNRFPEAWLSIDTYHSNVAREAIQAGAHIVNDISSGKIDAEMMQIVAALKVPYIGMHMQGVPKNMQENPQYENVTVEVRKGLGDMCQQASEAGITDIVVDLGFGFGKTVAHNFELLRNMHTFRMLGKPILAGLSRKSMICKTLHVNPEHALNGTTALNMVALQQGANILRVHDVKEAVEVISLFRALK